MSDSRNIFAGTPRKIITIFGCIVVALLMINSSCPSPLPFPPSPLSMPLLSDSGLSAHKFDTYRPSMQLSWTSPGTDSLPVKSFVILQKNDGDSGFAVLVREIPRTVTTYFDNLDKVSFPGFPNTKTIRYRIFAIDSLGRSGDTSQTDSIILLWQPNLSFPIERDTMTNATYLAWSVQSIQAGFYTTVFLYNDSNGLLWKNISSTPTYLTDGSSVYDTAQISSTILPLKPGNYSWAVRIDASFKHTTMAVSSFYVQ